jgi:hypothetical protein
VRRATAGMLLVGLATLALYALALLAVDFVPGADIRSPLPIWWTGAFAVAVAFAAWNVWDSWLDARAAYRRGSPERTRAGGLWRLRSDMLQGSCCAAMAGAGALAIVQWGTVELRTTIILLAALMLVVNQVWNRIDRERVSRMTAPVADARYHEAQATIRHLESELDHHRAERRDTLRRGVDADQRLLDIQQDARDEDANGPRGQNGDGAS